MSEPPINFREVLAERTGDSRKWTPLDALKAVVRDIENGAISPDVAFIALACQDADGRPVHKQYCAGADKTYYLGMLTRHIHIVLED